jgi:hypothetical protein
MGRRPSGASVGPSSAPRPGFRLSPRRRSCLPRTARSRPPHRPPSPTKREGGTTAPLRSSRVGRGRFRPRGPRSEALRDASGRPRRCGRGDPEGNFGENQLLDRSIGLSGLGERAPASLPGPEGPGGGRPGAPPEGRMGPAGACRFRFARGS